MPIIYGLWALVVVGFLVKAGNSGVVPAANWAGFAVVFVGLVHLITYIAIKMNKSKPAVIKQNEHMQTRNTEVDSEDDNGIAQRLAEESLYAEIAEEISAGNVRAGLMAKALAESEGNQDKKHALYIRYRMQSIKDEVQQGSIDSEQKPVADTANQKTSKHKSGTGEVASYLFRGALIALLGIMALSFGGTIITEAYMQIQGETLLFQKQDSLFFTVYSLAFYALMTWLCWLGIVWLWRK